MKAEYNHWYKCQEGQMPEDFKNCFTFNRDYTYDVLVTYSGMDGRGICVSRRFIHNKEWENCNHNFLAWMLPEPYKE